MPKQEIKNPFSTKKWCKMSKIPGEVVALKDREYTPFRGRINGECSIFFVGKFEDAYYAYSISKENLSQAESLQKRLTTNGCIFRPNLKLNPFGEGWSPTNIASTLENGEVRVSKTSMLGRSNDELYVFYSLIHKVIGCEEDWLRLLGFSIINGWVYENYIRYFPYM